MSRQVFQKVLKHKVRSVIEHVESEKDSTKIVEYKERAAQNLSNEIKKIKELQEVKAKRKQIVEAVRLHKSDWKSELSEAMTTAGMGMVNYGAVGDVDLDIAVSPFTLSGSSEHGYNSVTKSVRGDRSKYDTIVVRVTSSSSDWEITRGDVIQTLGSGGSGIKTIVIPRTYSSIYYTAKDDGNVTFHTVYQRRAPVNVFVPLDDPEANSFIRGGLGGDKNRREELKDMLEAGNEWMLMNGLDPSKTSPGDIELAGGKALYGPVDNRLKPDGSKGFNTPGELNKGNDGNWYEWDGNKWNPVPSLGLA